MRCRTFTPCWNVYWASMSTPVGCWTCSPPHPPLRTFGTNGITAAMRARVAPAGEDPPGEDLATHLAAYAGVAPVTRRPGSFIESERAPSGHSALKSALFLSAFASLGDPVSRAYPERKRTEKNRRNAAPLLPRPPPRRRPVRHAPRLQAVRTSPPATKYSPALVERRF